MIKRSFLLAVLCMLLAVTAGCSKRHRIQVESDTCWNGSVNDDQFINGCGNGTYKVIGTLRCVRLKKETVEGYLRVRIDERPWADTEDRFGIIQACN